MTRVARKRTGLLDDRLLAQVALDYKSPFFGELNVSHWFESNWSRYAPFADTAFATRLNKFVEALAKSAPESTIRADAIRGIVRLFWEMYLGVAMLDRNLSLVVKKGRSEAGPDLIVEHPDGRLCIEAVAPDGGTGPDCVEDHSLSMGQCRDVPNEQISLRLLQAIRDKSAQIDRWTAAGIVNAQDCVVIAINDHNIPYAMTDFTPPRIVRALFGAGMPAVDMDPRTGTFGSTYLTQQSAIQKKSGAPVATVAFVRGELSRISAVMSSSIHPWALLDRPGPDFVHVANPNAACRVPNGWLQNCIDYWLEYDSGTPRICSTQR